MYILIKGNCISKYQVGKCSALAWLERYRDFLTSLTKHSHIYGIKALKV